MGGKRVVNTNQSNHIVHLFTFPCALSVQTHQIDLMVFIYFLSCLKQYSVPQMSHPLNR